MGNVFFDTYFADFFSFTVTLLVPKQGKKVVCSNIRVSMSSILFFLGVHSDHFTLFSIPLTISSAYVSVVFVDNGENIASYACLHHDIDSLGRIDSLFFLYIYICRFYFALFLFEQPSVTPCLLIHAF